MGLIQQNFFASYWRCEAVSTDVCMCVAILWEPCGSGDEIEFYFEVLGEMWFLTNEMDFYKLKNVQPQQDWDIVMG